MGLSWQQAPLSPGAIGTFLVPDALPERLLYAEPLRRRLRVQFGGSWIADSEHVLLLFEPRRLVMRRGDRLIAENTWPLALYESGFAPRWYVPRGDIDEAALTPVGHQTFCPYKGLCSYYDIGEAKLASSSYPDAYAEVGRISNLSAADARPAPRA